MNEGLPNQRSNSEVPQTRPPNIIAISGGKGGVGKTSIAVNLAIALARLKHRVCLLDGDAGLANVNILLRLEPRFTLEHLISGERSITEIMLPGPEGLTIIPGASGVSQCAEMDQQAQTSLIDGLEQIESSFDWMVADTAAGISATTIRMIDSAQLTAIVITPEPTSLTDAFSLLKVMRRNGYDRRVLVIVNMASSSDQPQAIFRRFQTAVNKYIGLDTQYLGCVWMDESMRMAVANQKPVATLPETDPSCRRFLRLADSLISFYEGDNGPRQTMSHYWRNLITSSGQAGPHNEDKPQKQPKADNKAKQPKANSCAAKADGISIDSLLEFIQNSATIDSNKALELANALLERVPKDQREPETTTATTPPPQPKPAVTDGATLNGAEAPTSITRELTTSDHRNQYQKASPRVAYYNEERFGPQDALAAKIRDMSNNTSLDELLSQF